MNRDLARFTTLATSTAVIVAMVGCSDPPSRKDQEIESMQIRQGGISPNAESHQLFTKTFRVPLNFMQLIEPPPPEPFSETGHNVSGFMDQYGITLETGCRAIFNPEEGTLEVTNTADQLRLIGEVVETFPVLSEDEERSFVSSIIRHQVVLDSPSDPNRLTNKYALPKAIYERMISPELTAPDPFAPERIYEDGQLTPHAALENAGIAFSPGANVRYDEETGELTVTNTPDQMDFLEAYLGSLDEGKLIFDRDSRFHRDESNPKNDARHLGPEREQGDDAN
ncbi:MAG: hypothetical protein P1U86_15020 [Verrucomicrobiales bacterium]|nr:hypothetical protein [Verrucomicrobiales bacterium]